MTEWELRLIQEHRNRNTAAICAAVFNASGNLKQQVTPDDFMPTASSPEEQQLTPEEQQAAYVAMMMNLAKRNA